MEEPGDQKIDFGMENLSKIDKYFSEKRIFISRENQYNINKGGGNGALRFRSLLEVR